jgi:4-amino-4-deoxy-L-arabinose transferase
MVLRALLGEGPPALLPLLALVALGRLSPRRPALAEPLGLAAFAVAGLSWYGWVALRHAGLLGYLVGDEVVGRALSNEFGRNPQWWKPFVIYLPVLLLGQGTWVAVGARIPWREGLASPRRLWARVRRGDGGSLLLLWLLLPLAVFFAASSRLPLYVLPLYAPVALAVARALVRERGSAAPRRALALALPSVVVLVALKAAAAHALPPSDKDMAELHAAVRREGGPAAEVRAFGDERLYGLQFYLGGALRRVSWTGGEPWADESVARTVERLRGGGPRLVLVAPGRDAPRLETALAAAGVPYRRAAAGSRALLVFSPERGAEARAEGRP